MKRLLVLFFAALFVFSNSVFADVTGTLRPVSDGGNETGQWKNASGDECASGGVNCYLEVDESSGSSCANSDGDASYIEAVQNGAHQTFDIDEASIPDNAEITRIDITVCYRQKSPGNGNRNEFQTRRCVDGSCANSGTTIATASSYTETTQSHTGLSITKNASTDIEIGASVTGTTEKEIRISQISAAITYTAPDTAAPDAVSDLAASGATETTIDLAWTAPGDDGSTGTATKYDVRYSTATITESSWASATKATGEPSPSAAGSAESLTVTGLAEDTTYYFALKTADEVPNESSISNVASLATASSADDIAPLAVVDLAVSDTTDTTASLMWTAPGDDGNTGVAASYDMRYSKDAITDGNWADATKATGEPSPSAAGSSESMILGGLSANTAYHFAVKASDEALNESVLSNVPSGTTDAPAPDSTAPAAVGDLALSPGAGTMTVSWTAPGDDGNTGVAASYDMRYSKDAITDGNWADATKVLGEPSPASAGAAESMTIIGLESQTAYYFALKITDEALNESGISNVPTATTTASSAGAGGARKAVFSGQAYPGSTIELLRKRIDLPGYIKEPTETLTILEDGTFEIIQEGIIGESFLFALRVSDIDGRRTGLISFNVDLRQENELVARGIFVPPTLEVVDQLVSKGEQVRIVGYAGAGNSIEYELHGTIRKAGKADKSGLYAIDIDTAEFDFADHYVRVRQVDPSGADKSNFSSTGVFRVSELTFPRADFNKDEKVDITDWSVFLFRWGSEDEALRQKIDLDNNGKVDIADFSIFLQSMTI